MYIKRLALKNIRCFKSFSIDFEERGSSVLLIGENGDGKTTILRSLAMGLLDESSTAALFRELQGEFVRRKEGEVEVPAGNSGSIEVDLASRDGFTYRVNTRITSLEIFERISQKLYKFREGEKPKLIKQKDFPWERIFISGYGPGVRTQATSDFQHYLPVDAVYPLFSYSSHLQNPELAIYRILFSVRGKAGTLKERVAREQKVFLMIQKLMADLLDLDSADQFKLTSTGIKVEGHWGISELKELGDGYQAVINLVMDLMSWWFLRKNGRSKLDLDSIKGIVIIDEIEQHLHPKWQRTIFSRLREKFPKIQFIIATHSPLVVSANENVDVHLLRPGGHEIFNPFGWLAEDVYEKMGVKSTRSSNYKILDEYEKLRNKQVHGVISKIELRKLKQLRKDLAQLPESDPVRLTTDIMSITESLRRLEKS